MRIVSTIVLGRGDICHHSRNVKFEHIGFNNLQDHVSHVCSPYEVVIYVEESQTKFLRGVRE